MLTMGIPEVKAVREIDSAASPRAEPECDTLAGPLSERCACLGKTAHRPGDLQDAHTTAADVPLRRSGTLKRGTRRAIPTQRADPLQHPRVRQGYYPYKAAHLWASPAPRDTRKRVLALHSQSRYKAMAVSPVRLGSIRRNESWVPVFSFPANVLSHCSGSWYAQAGFGTIAANYRRSATERLLHRPACPGGTGQKEHQSHAIKSFWRSGIVQRDGPIVHSSIRCFFDVLDATPTRHVLRKHRLDSNQPPDCRVSELTAVHDWRAAISDIHT